jgi:isoleucyl-tRNA synthetase
MRKEKVIGNSLQAAVDLYAGAESLRVLLDRYRGFLKTLFIVSQVELHDQEAFSADQRHHSEPLSLTVGVRKADGDKCELCWNYSPTVGQHQVHTTLCERCIRIIGQL